MAARSLARRPHIAAKRRLQSDSLTILSRICSIAREGARPLGHTSVQFMMVRQRNEWLSGAVQEQGDEHGGVFDGLERVYFAACKAQEIALAQRLAFPGAREFDRSLDALHGDLARNLVCRHGLARQKNHAEHFEVRRFVERPGARVFEFAAQRTNVDQLTR